MSREQKLALILGFLAVLVVAMLISDHYSKANKDRLAAEVADAPQVIDPATPSPYSGPLASNTPGNFAPLPPTVDPSSNIAGNGFLDRALASNQTPGQTQGQTPGQTPGAADPISNAGTPGAPEPVVLTMGGKNADPTLSRDSTLLDELRRQGEALTNGLREMPAAANSTQVPVEPSRTAESDALQRQLDQAAKSNTTPAKTEAPAAERWHVVAANDSLFAISKKYYGDGKYWKKLAEANKSRMGNNNTLRPGVRLLIPDAAALGIAGATTKVDPAKPDATKPIANKPETKPTTKPDAKTAAKPDTKPATTTGPRVYEVKKGDTLGQIAMRELGTSKRANEILTLNKLADADDIHIGQKLKLPAK